MEVITREKYGVAKALFRQIIQEEFLSPTTLLQVK